MKLTKVKTHLFKCALNSVTFFVLVALVFVNILQARAQNGGYYLLEYTFEGLDTTKYHAFAIDNGDEHGLMRIIYWDKGKVFMVEQKTVIKKETYKSKDGKFTIGLVLKGSNAKIISQSNYGHYFPDVIVLKKNESDSLYSPDYVYSDDDSKRNFGQILKFQQLKKNSHQTRVALSKFNLTLPEIPSQIAPMTTLYLILVSNTDNGDAGTQFLNNHRKLKALFKEAAGLAGIKTNIVEVTGSNFDKQSLLKGISFTPKNSDIIIFYYSGHGYRTTPPPLDSTSNDRWPKIILTNSRDPNIIRDQSYDLFDIHKTLLGKGAKLTMIFSECCNRVDSIMVQLLPQPINPAITAEGLGWNRSIISDLLSKTGNLLLNTCGPNQFSFYDRFSCGYFCTRFVESFNARACIPQDKFTNNLPQGYKVDWQSIIRDATIKTKEDVIKIGQRQNPIMSMDIR